MFHQKPHGKMGTPSHNHSSENAEAVLKKHGLRLTQFRAQIWEIFNKNGFALSLQDLENQLGTFDRITLYRTLKSFEEKGLIHKLADAGGGSKYALCEGKCDEDHHHDHHVHFHCEKCDKSFCIDEVSVPAVNVPEGYTMTSRDMMVKGVCKECNHN